MNGSTEPTLLTASEFADRVMTAVALTPAPTPTRTFVAALRTRAVRDALAALWVAWHLGTVRTWHVAPRVRARSFALVLAVTSVLATGGLAAAAAVHSVVPQRDDQVQVSAPNGSSVDEGPTVNGGSASDGPDETDASESPPSSAEPDHTNHAGSGTTVDGSGGDDAGHVTRGAASSEDEADDGDDDGADDGDDHPAATDDHDGSDGGDGPGATDDHEGSGGDAPDASVDPDHSSDGGDVPDTTDDTSGASGGDLSGAEPGGD